MALVLARGPRELEPQEEHVGVGGLLSQLPGCISFIFSLWICYEIQPAVVTLYTAVQNVWTISLARNDQFESGFRLKRLAIYMKTTHK